MNQNILRVHPRRVCTPNVARACRRDRYCRQVGAVCRVDCRCWILRQFDEIVCARSRLYSYSKVVDDVSVSIHLDHVFKFGIGHDRDGCSESCRKFQTKTHAALSYQTKVIVLTQIGRQIECVESIAATIVFASDERTRLFFPRIPMCTPQRGGYAKCEG